MARSGRREREGCGKARVANLLRAGLSAARFLTPFVRDTMTGFRFVLSGSVRFRCEAADKLNVILNCLYRRGVPSFSRIGFSPAKSFSEPGSHCLVQIDKWKAFH
jgi:hypothetical protein